MAQNGTTTTGDASTREETTRHVDTIDRPIIEGDRISKQLVARTLGQLGHRTRSGDSPKTQLVALTAYDQYDDTHHALLFDPKGERWLRASRHSSSAAWTQKEADWTVHAAGGTLVATGGELESTPDDVADPAEYVAGWLEIVASELFYDAVHGQTADIHDELDLMSNGNVHLRDFDGREAYATFRLDDGDGRTALDIDE